MELLEWPVWLSLPFFFLPVGLLLLLGIVILALQTLFAVVVSLTERQFLVALLSILLLGVFGWFPFQIHSNLYLLGVRQRICSQMTPDQIRLLAALIMKSPRSENGSLLTSTPAWRKVQTVPGFSILDHDLGFSVGPYGMVAIFGGCSVCGHTGLQVQESAVTNRYSKGDHLSIAPDIEVFYDPK